MLICNEVESSRWMVPGNRNQPQDKPWLELQQGFFLQGLCPGGQRAAFNPVGPEFLGQSWRAQQEGKDTQCAEWQPGCDPAGALPRRSGRATPLLGRLLCDHLQYLLCRPIWSTLGQPLPDLTPKFCWTLPALQSAHLPSGILSGNGTGVCGIQDHSENQED